MRKVIEREWCKRNENENLFHTCRRCANLGANRQNCTASNKLLLPDPFRPTTVLVAGENGWISACCLKDRKLLIVICLMCIFMYLYRVGSGTRRPCMCTEWKFDSTIRFVVDARYNHNALSTVLVVVNVVDSANSRFSCCGSEGDCAPNHTCARVHFETFRFGTLLIRESLRNTTN